MRGYQFPGFSPRAGTLRNLSGDGSAIAPSHVLAGKVFVASMLVMAVCAVYLGIVKHQPNNVSGGIFTFYLIGTAWLTAKRRDGETGRLDWAALLIPLALGTLTWLNGINVVRSGARSQDRVPVGMTFFMGSVMLLAASGDLQTLARSGVLGAKRFARHLWRMCFGLFIAAGSFFSGTLKPPAKIAFVNWRRQTPTASFVLYRLVFDSHHAPARHLDFLVSASSFHQ
jgi:hypothetical protein